MSQDNAGLFSDRRPASSEGGEWITAHCDGGSRGNPGPAGFGVFIEGPDGEKLAELSEYIGRTTNNVAEYSALLAALDFALKQGHRRLRVVADSELMVKQMQGRYKVNSPDLRPLYEEAKQRVAGLERFRIEHVLRGKNQKADRLANLAMDKAAGRPEGRSGASRHPGGPAGGPASAPGSTSRPTQGPSVKPLKGYVKGGVVHLLEGELPDGVFVRVTLDRQ